MRGRPEVLLWPDTFTNHFDPRIGEAAVDVLEHAGFSVVVPGKPLCCGLTWISTGQLKTAKRVLRRTLRQLRRPIEAGMPVVGLEPSCTAVFRSDLHELLPHDQDGTRLRKQTYTLAEFLAEKAPGWETPILQRDAIVQGHCHHKAIMQMDADKELWSKMALDAEMLDSGCCGLAGNFGFERGHHDVSVACAERVLLPRVREAAAQTLVMADGFSCRTQIAELSRRRALHTAQVLQMALRKGEPSTEIAWAEGVDELYYNYEMRKIGIEELSGRGHAAATGRYESRGHAAASGRYAPAAGLAEKDS